MLTPSRSAIRQGRPASGYVGTPSYMTLVVPCASKHRDGELGQHRKVEGHAVPDLDAAEILKERTELVDPRVELLIGDLLGLFVLRLGHPDQGRLVRARGQVAVDAVDAGVQSSPDEPLPERRVARVQRRVPVRIPDEEIRVLLEALREVLLAEPLEDRRIGRVRLSDERRRRGVELLLPPVHGDLRLGDLRLVYISHWSPPTGNSSKTVHHSARASMTASNAPRRRGPPRWLEIAKEGVRPAP